MSTRTPRTQPRSQFHSYWGAFAYAAVTPSPTTFLGRALSEGGMELPNAPNWTGGDASQLEAGDNAFVFDPLASTGNLYTSWICLDPGTIGGLDAIWDRVAPLGGGIRDAHVIVVAHQNTSAPQYNLTTGDVDLDARLQMNPQVQGTTVDFVDSGDGAQLTLALAAAQAMLLTDAGRVDVRMRPCSLRLDGSSPVIRTITVPENVRLIGAGSGLSRITGWADGDQTVFYVQGRLSGWEVTSPPPEAATSGSSQGVVVLENVTASMPVIEDITLNLGVSDTFARTQRVGIQVLGDCFGGAQVCDCFIRQVDSPQSALSHFTLFGTELIGVQVRGVLADLGASVSDVRMECCDVALDIFGSNEVRAHNIQGTSLFRYGYRYQNSFFPSDLQGASLSVASFTFHETEAVATTAAIRIGFSQDGQLIGPVLTSVRARWPSTASATRIFIDAEAGTAGRSIRSLQAVNCTVDASNSSVAATTSINLDASGGGSIRGGITTSDIANATTVTTQAGTVTWVQANLL